MLFALVLGTAAPAPAQHESGRLDPITLQLKWQHQFQSAGFYAAIEQGYYREAGLEVTLREPTQGVEPAEVVLSGEAEFGVATSALLLHRSRGLPVVALAPIFQHSPLIFVVRADAGIDSVHDLHGKRIMIAPHEEELLAYLEFEGISREDIEIVPHSFSPDDFINGDILAMSAYTTDQPFLFEQAGVDYLIFSPRAGGIDFYGDTLFTTEAQIREHPDRVKRFLEASLKGWEYALDHPGDVIELILEAYSRRKSADHLAYEAEMTERHIVPGVIELGYMNPGRWRHIADTYAQLGMMPADFALEGFLYSHYLERRLAWFYWVLGLILLITGVVGTLAWHFYRLSQTIRKQAETLSVALAEIKVLRGVIPICSHCKKIRDDAGAWRQLEHYISTHSEAVFSHGICEDCMEREYGDLLKPD